MPIVASEINGLFVQDKPVPFRQTLVNAVHNADDIRIMLQPQYNVKMANFWQLSNSYFGMIRGGKGAKERWSLQANYYVYELYNKYLGNELVQMDIVSPRFEFPGGENVSPRMGTPSSRKSMDVRSVDSPWSRRYFREGTQTQSGNVVSVDFDQNVDANYYHAYKEFDVEPNTLYKISVRVRTFGIKGDRIGVAVEDSRGWNATHYQPANISLSGTTPWTWLTVEFRTLADTKSIKVMARRISGNGIISGRADFGETRVEMIRQNFGSVDSVVGTASRKGGGVSLVLINKNLFDYVDVTVQIGAEYKAITAEKLSGPSPYSTNLSQSDLIKITHLDVKQEKSGVMTVRLPPASVNGMKFTRSPAS